MAHILFTIISIIAIFTYSTSSQSCDTYTEEAACIASGSCEFLNDVCICASDVELDILFGVDTSGSIGFDNFQILKQFLKTLLTQGINNGSRIGIWPFSTTVNQTTGIQFWSNNDLSNYIDGLYWTGGYTNTPSLLELGYLEFEDTFDALRKQILVLLTDGNPCLPVAQGGCPQTVCHYETLYEEAGIRIVIIGVGELVSDLFVGCLAQQDSDFIPVESFSEEDFNSIMGTLSDIVCPTSKEFKITEIKPVFTSEKESRFVEIYNSGSPFSIDDISISGLLTMSTDNGLNTSVSQGQYVVFFSATDYTPTFESFARNNLCLLSDCSTAENAIYIGCSSSADNTGINCDINVARLDIGAINACNICVFDDSGITTTNWDVAFSDNGGLIDSVIYDINEWITIEDGFSYELVSKELDNDIGDNWAQSCSKFGTPGKDPVASCD